MYKYQQNQQYSPYEHLFMNSEPEHHIFFYTPYTKHIRLLQLQKSNPQISNNSSNTIMRDFYPYSGSTRKNQQNFLFQTKRCFMLDQSITTIQKQQQSLTPLNYHKQYKKLLKKQLKHKIFYWYTNNQNVIINNQKHIQYLSYPDVNNLCFGRRYFLRSYNAIELASDNISRDHCQLVVKESKNYKKLKSYFNWVFCVGSNNKQKLSQSRRNNHNPINNLTKQLWQKIFQFLQSNQNQYYLIDNGSRNGSFFIQQQSQQTRKSRQIKNKNIQQYNPYGTKIEINHQVDIREGFSYEFQGEEYLIKIWRVYESSKKKLYGEGNQFGEYKEYKEYKQQEESYSIKNNNKSHHYQTQSQQSSNHPSQTINTKKLLQSILFLQIIKQFQQNINWYNNFQKVGKQYLIDQSLLKRQLWVNTYVYNRKYSLQKKQQENRFNKKKSYLNKFSRNNSNMNSYENFHYQNLEYSQNYEAFNLENANLNHEEDQQEENEIVQNQNIPMANEQFPFQHYRVNGPNSDQSTYPNAQSSSSSTSEPQILSQYLSRSQFIQLLILQLKYLQKFNTYNNKFSQHSNQSTKSQQKKQSKYYANQQKKSKNSLYKKQTSKCKQKSQQKYQIQNLKEFNNNLFIFKHQLNLIVLSLDFNNDFKRLYCLITLKNNIKKFHIGTHMAINTSRYQQYEQTHKCNGYINFNGKSWQMVALKLVYRSLNMNNQANTNNKKLKKKAKINQQSSSSQSSDSQQSIYLQQQPAQNEQQLQKLPTKIKAAYNKNNNVAKTKTKRYLNLQKMIGNKIWTKIPGGSQYQLNPKKCTKYMIRLAHAFYFQLKFINYHQKVQQQKEQKDQKKQSIK